jgi:hypothetical protein
MQEPKSRTPSVRAHDEGVRAEFLGEVDAVIAGIGLGEGRELARAFPVEAARFDDHAADRHAMTADELGGRVEHDVGAQAERPAEHRRGEGVVDHQRNLRLVGDVGDDRNVEHLATRLPMVFQTRRVSGLMALRKPTWSRR